MDAERDRLIRVAAFAHLERVTTTHGDVIPWAVLREGFLHDGQVVPLIAQQGIFKPAIMELPLSITTSPRSPYDDEVSDDGFLRYRYRGTDSQHPDNVRLREAGRIGLPLVYFHGISVGQYQPFWPVFVQADDPVTLTFTVAVLEPHLLRPDLSAAVVDEAQRAYATGIAVKGSTKRSSASESSPPTALRVRYAGSVEANFSTRHTSSRIAIPGALRSSPTGLRCASCITPRSTRTCSGFDRII